MILHSRPDYVDSLRAFKAEVFLGSDVSVPAEIQMILALPFMMSGKSEDGR